MSSLIRTILLIFLFVFMGSLFAANWTILVYMAADNGLSQYAVSDINEMESAEIPASVNIIVQVDFSGISNPSGAYRYKIVHDESDDNEINSILLANLGEIDSGDPETLSNFIGWGLKKYPADHTALVIWSHAESWYKGFDLKWLCPDNTSETVLSVANGDLKRALADSYFDILLFDACSMMTIEVLNEVKDFCKYTIGSEDLVPATGFPYGELLPLFIQNSSVDEIANRIPKVYTNSYDYSGSQNPDNLTLKVTCSSVRADFVDSLTTILNELAIKMRIHGEECLLWRNQCYPFNNADADIDIFELVNVIITTTQDQDMKSICTEIINLHNKPGFINAITIETIHYTYNIGAFTIWFPPYQNIFELWWQKYQQLSFAQNRLWTSMLNVSYGSDYVRPNPPEIVHVIAPGEYVSIELKLQPDTDPINLLFNLYNEVGSFLKTICYTPNNSMSLENVLFRIDQTGFLYCYTKDLSGNISDSIKINLNYNNNAHHIQFYPNPLNPTQSSWCLYNINPSNQSNYQAKLFIYNLRGQLVLKLPVALSNEGLGGMEMSKYKVFTNLSTGIYIAELCVGSKKYKGKFTIIK